MRYRVVYHFGEAIELQTRMASGCLTIAEGQILINGKSSVAIPLASIRSIEMFRLNGVGRMLKVILEDRTLFITVVRLNLFGYFVVVNFLGTGKLHDLLCSHVHAHSDVEQTAAAERPLAARPEAVGKVVDSHTPQQATLSYATPPALRPDAIIIRNDKKVAIGCIVGGMLALIFGIYCWLHPLFFNEWWFIGVGGLVLVGGVWLLVDTRPRLILDDDGFTDFKVGLGRLAWEQIAEVRTAIRNYAPYLYITLTDVAAVRQKLSVWDRAKYPRPSDAGPQELTVPLAGLAVKPDILVKLMRDRMGRAVQLQQIRNASGQ